jgi:hypothetical protein
MLKPRAYDNFRPPVREVRHRDGELPYSLLASKFEETDMGEDTNEKLQTMWRGTLKDRGPDQSMFTHEEKRIDRGSRQALNLRYNGHLGSGEYAPDHSEMMLDFAGEEWRDPRGTAVDADMKLMRKQQEARMKFRRMDSDAEFRTTGGGVAPQQMIRDIRKAQTLSGVRQRNFLESIDGRREGLRREYKKVTKVGTSVNDLGAHSYTDILTDSALTPQRKTEIVSNLTDTGGFGVGVTKMYHQAVPDHTVTVASYGEIPGRRLAEFAPTTTEHRMRVEEDVKHNKEKMAAVYTAMNKQVAGAVAGLEDASNAADETFATETNRRNEVSAAWTGGRREREESMISVSAEYLDTPTQRKQNHSVNRVDRMSNIDQDTAAEKLSAVAHMRKQLDKTAKGAVISETDMKGKDLTRGGRIVKSARMYAPTRPDRDMSAIDLQNSVAVTAKYKTKLRDKHASIVGTSDPTITMSTSRESKNNRRRMDRSDVGLAHSGMNSGADLPGSDNQSSGKRFSRHPSIRFVNRDLSSDYREDNIDR